MSNLDNFLEARKKRRTARRKRMATPWDAYSSVPGDRLNMPYWPVSSFTSTSNFSAGGIASAASMCAAQASAFGGGDGGGAAGGAVGGMGECVDSQSIPCGLTIVANTVDGLAKSRPNSDVVSEMKRLFDRLRADPASYTEPVYQGGDGMDANPSGDEVSCLAAACEATLGAFKRATGIDYEEFRNRT